MSSDLLQSFFVVFAMISAALIASLLARGLAEQAAGRRPPPAAPPLPVRAAGPPAHGETAPAPPLMPMQPAATGEGRPARRPSLAGARRGIVLLTILGPCRALAPDHDVRS